MLTMKTESEFKQIVANNITMYRKANGLTQLQLAEKLNYSDKAISKWERGESLPDLYILFTIAEMFGITINDLIEKQIQAKSSKNKLNKNVVTWLSVGLTWLIGCLVFTVLQMVGLKWSWLTFPYTLVCSLIVLVVFSKLWGDRLTLFLGVSTLIFSVPLAVCLQLGWKYNCGYLFLLTVPLEILTILWFFRKFHN